MAGPLLETLVVTELLRQAPHTAARPALHHLRTSDGLEVDVVLEGGNEILPFGPGLWALPFSALWS